MKARISKYDRLISAEVGKHLPLLPGHTAQSLKAELQAAVLMAGNRWNHQQGPLNSWVFIYVRGRVKDLLKEKGTRTVSLEAIEEAFAPVDFHEDEGILPPEHREYRRKQNRVE